MAFQGTHIKFAVQFVENYKIQNSNEVLLGSIYPDSRYATKIDRTLTHPTNFKSWDLSRISDFKKGWYSHIYYDELQRSYFKKHMAAIWPNETISQESDEWVNITALKLIQDMLDLKSFAINKHIPSIKNFVKTPNEENLAQLQCFYESVIHFFENTTTDSTPDDYLNLLTETGLSEDVAKKIIRQANLLKQNNKVVQILESAFDSIILQSSKA